jgi:hypothetical protein
MNMGLSGLVLLGGAAVAGAAIAQPNTAPAAAANPLVSVSPDYVTIPMEIIVNQPAARVWDRVGKYCDIGEWLQIGDCIIRSGTGEIGTIRSVGEEVMVGKTPLSYTYAQTVGFQARGAGANRPYDLYHGTLEARPIDATSSKLVYTLVYDSSTIPGGDAAKKTDMERRRAVFERALANMKVLAEGGTLPPPPARPSVPAVPTPG